MIAHARRTEPSESDGSLDRQMTACLRDGASARHIREQATAREEARDYERMTAGLRALIDGRLGAGNR